MIYVKAHGWLLWDNLITVKYEMTVSEEWFLRKMSKENERDISLASK